MIQIVVPLLLLLALKNTNGEPKVFFNRTEVQIHMDEVVPISFTIESISNDSTISNFRATSSNLYVVKLDVPSFNSSLIHNGSYKSFINATGIFLGNAKINMSVIVNGKQVVSEAINVIVIRSVRLVDKLFTASVATLVSILYINFGCAMDWDSCKKTIKRPVGPLIGCFCQFLLMPMISYCLAILLFPESPEMQLGIFFTGISPSGGASNIWTMLLGGNLNLSVTMTTLCTLAAFGMMPLWIFTLGKHIFDRGNLAMPYDKVATFAIGLIIPLALGYFIQKKLPRLSKVLVRMMKPFSLVLIIFIIVFAIVTNLYLFKLFSWKIILAGMGLPWLGFLSGMLVAIFFRQSNQDVRAIAIETGIQNTGVAIFLLRFSLKQPAADLTTVAPVCCAIMTPLPLLVLYIVKIILDRRKQLAASIDNLRNPNNLLSSSSYSSTRLSQAVE